MSLENSVFNNPIFPAHKGILCLQRRDHTKIIGGLRFRVRLERTTPLETAYLRAMASLGTESAKASEVAALLHRSTEQCGPIRARLIEKGLLYTTSHGMVSFTVPQFGAFMIRNGPLDVPPKRARR